MARCCCNQSEENWYQHCWPFQSSSSSSKVSGKSSWCDCAYSLQYISLHTLSQNRTVSAQRVSIDRLVFCDIRWLFHFWEECLQPACTSHDWISPVYCSAYEDPRSKYATTSLWIHRWRWKAKYTILIRSFCRVVKCCCLQKANIRRPLRRESLRSSRYRLGDPCTSYSKSFQGLHNTANHRQFSAFIQVCMYYSAQSLQFSLHFSSQSASFKA